MRNIRSVLAITWAFGLGGAAFAQVPGLIHYQGRVTVAGTNYTGTGQFRFALVDGSGVTMFWSNGVAAVSVPVSKGLYGVMLGDAGMEPLPASVFANSDVRLRVTFNGQALSPDQRLGAVGYALAAAQAESAAVALNVSPASDLTAQRLSVGSGHTLSGGFATIAGGNNNTAGGDNATVGGGRQNRAVSAYSTIGGGSYNYATNSWATIAGGRENLASNDNATVGGGFRNAAGGYGATVAGGRDNSAAGTSAAVGGGAYNAASTDYATVAGGHENKAGGAAAAVGGGYKNQASGSQSTIAGGRDNFATNTYATVLGGAWNVAGGHGSAAGGQAAKALHEGAFVWSDYWTPDFVSTAPRQFLIRAAGGVGIGTNAPASALHVNGTVTATSFAGSGVALTGIVPADNSVTSAKIADGTIVDADINGTTGISGSKIIGGDLAATRLKAGSGHTLSGSWATIAGGTDNTASSSYATVGGGRQNRAMSTYSTIGGGSLNYATNDWATIAGGRDNIAAGTYAAVGGGAYNTATNDYATVAGGHENKASGAEAAVGGGYLNAAGGYGATVAGGVNNIANANYATVPGGWYNTAGAAFSFAAGRRAKAMHDGAFVWGDSTDDDFNSTAANQLLLRATGGVGIGTNAPASALHVNGTVTATAFAGSGAGLSDLPAPADGSVTSAKIADGAIVNADISASAALADTKLATITTAGKVADSALSANVTKLGGSIESSEITDGVIVNADISASAAIADTKLATISTAGKVGDSALSANVTKLGGSIESSEITDGAIVNADISASAAIADTKLATISTAGKVADSALSANVSKLGQSIESSEITDGTITDADINGTTGISGSKIIGGDLAATRLKAGSGHTLSGSWATIAGGTDNTTSDDFATVGGGKRNTSGYYATVGGGYDNAAGGFATVGGGVDNAAGGGLATVGGGNENTAGGYAATVGGGRTNTASNTAATVGGGYDNTAGGEAATIGGGYRNAANGIAAFIGGGGYDGTTYNGNTASGTAASIVGGTQNIATGSRSSVGGGHNNSAINTYATVPGGAWNVAGGVSSFAAGQATRALHDGSFVWGDTSTLANMASTAINQFSARCAGGVRFYSNSGMSLGAQLAPNATAWTTLSDRDAKENFATVDARAALEALAAMPVSSWNYRDDPTQRRYIGPTAQDFHKAFGLGDDDKRINSLDTDGVALAAIKGLHQLVQEKEARIAELERRNTAFENRLAELERWAAQGGK
jgi:hypothetical protein